MIRGYTGHLPRGAMLKFIGIGVFLGFFLTLAWQLYENPRSCNEVGRCLSTLGNTAVWPYYWYRELA